MLDFNKIVKKMCKRCGNILFKQDIFELIDPEMKPEYQTQVNKIIYRLKSENKIIVLKAGVYVVPTDEDRGLNSVDLLEKYYLRLLKKYITHHVGAAYYISGSKALQIHMKDFSIPEKIFVMNRSLNKKVVIGNYEIIFKTISGKLEGKKLNLYARLSKEVQVKQIESIDFKVANLELSLLEAAVVHESYGGVDIGLLTRCLKKYHTVLQMEKFYEIGKYKYIMSMNRLKELSKTIAPELSQVCLDVIKKNGGLFIGEGLRGF